MMNSPKTETRRVFAFPDLTPSQETTAFLREAERRGLERSMLRRSGGSSARRPDLLAASGRSAAAHAAAAAAAAASVTSSDVASVATPLGKASGGAREGGGSFRSVCSLSFIDSDIADGAVKLPSEVGKQHHSTATPRMLRRRMSSSLSTAHRQQQQQQQQQQKKACLSSDALKKNSAVLQHDRKEISVFEKANKLQELDRTLVRMTREVEEESAAARRRGSGSGHSPLRKQQSFLLPTHHVSLAAAMDASAGAAGSSVSPAQFASVRRQSLRQAHAVPEKPALEEAAWSKHIPPSFFAQLTPRTRHLAEGAAIADVAQMRQEKMLRKSKSMRSIRSAGSAGSGGGAIG